MSTLPGQATRVAAPEPPPPALQRWLESIPFLIVVGLVMPTLLYTVWSITELALLPRFSDTAVHAAPTHGASAEAAAPAAATGVTTGTAVAADAVRVSMRQLAYVPKTLEIAAGTTVTWTNDDTFPHAVAHGTPDTPAGERLFASGDFPAGSSFSYTFATPGTYDVFCSTVGHYQAGMTMTVVVKE
jgi:plastocyanin